MLATWKAKPTYLPRRIQQEHQVLVVFI